MKLYKFIALAFAGAAIAASCTKMDEIQPEGGTLLASQVKETNAVLPERADASYVGMYTKLGEPCSVYSSRGSYRADDFGFIMSAISGDVESADAIFPDSNYNWFSVCGEYSSRNANYANPYIRYAAPYNEIAAANDVILAFPSDSEDPDILAKIAEAKAIRAYSYLCLAPYFQFTYLKDKTAPCVPLVTEEAIDYTNNPRASLEDVYNQILSDLDYAIEHLEGRTRSAKYKVDANVAHGLRARAYLTMGEWQKAYDDAVAAADGYTPATIDELTNRTVWFKDINEHNWIWGYDMSQKTAEIFEYATSSSWLRSFSAYAYSNGVQVYCMINSLLWNKISDSDVRKGWWVDENLESPILKGLAWPGYTDVANVNDPDNGTMTYLPYTNVKFGCNTVATVLNDEDYPFMRVEEMLLIEAECQARLGNETGARKILDDFIGTYRDPAYSSIKSSRSLLDEIWFQRRIELWGEGFANPDARRLQKPIVRFHKGETNNQPDAFAFNLAADDPWLLMRFPQAEMNTNFGIEDNTGSQQPVQGQNGDLKDGVTD